jgi:uncharacterized protein YdeI (YjbR/CyaY-like superfamily)
VSTLAFETATQWELWLENNHAQGEAVWLKIAKKHSGCTSVSIDEALDVALCYGWIDSQRKPLDGTHFLQRFSRRQSKSPWSKINIARVEGLRAAGRMRAPGLAAFEAAQATPTATAASRATP